MNGPVYPGHYINWCVYILLFLITEESKKNPEEYLEKFTQARTIHTLSLLPSRKSYHSGNTAKNSAENGRHLCECVTP